MSANYVAILWNSQKKTYDKILWLGILFFIVAIVVFQFLLHPTITVETVIIRVTALTSFFLLHIILMIGPLCRIEKRFLPILYNRRHLGVSMFIIAAIHGIFSIMQYQGFGDTNPILGIFISNQKYLEISAFPFQTLGFFALIILFLMAATSHDFWLKNLSPRIWKILHMGVYVAYMLIFLHVATGALQYETNPIYWVFLVAGFICIASLHIVAGLKETKKLKTTASLEKEGFYNVCDLNDIESDCGKSVFINGENIAIFKYDGKISAVNNICKHQMGPLGEGKVIDGCITCPWHGYQYLPENGQAPPPFKEQLTTYDTKVVGNSIWVNPNPHPEGTPITPSRTNDNFS